MADTPAKRMREAKKRRQQEQKVERKRLRKEGLLGTDNSGLFVPGEVHRETENARLPEPPPAPEEPKPPEPQP
ncbi:MAG: hypothetical protein HYY17_03100 [Planctomycetes bacterium]|nr:hypothetical protein [Planctomycetota bacterium]